MAIAAAGCVVATSWMLERATVTSGDPFQPITDGLANNPLAVAAALACLALMADCARQRSRAARRAMASTTSTRPPVKRASSSRAVPAARRRAG